MQYALWQGEGFIMVTGLPGTGKTTLIEQFQSELNNARTLIANLTSTQLQADELLRLICLTLGVVVETQNKAGIIHELRQFLIQHSKDGKRVLLLIDEAQDLPEHALEELRLLGGLQLNGRPLLQIFLVGQQHLLDMVEGSAMQPLYQRLVAACHLEPLNLDETRAYIEHRLQRAGWEGGPAFDERSYRMIHRFSEGFPRQINKVCSRLLLYGGTENIHKIDGTDCLKVLRELLEELPNSTCESNFQACVDLLIESCSDPAERDDEVDAPVEATPALVVQPPPSLADEHARMLATPEPETVQSHSDGGYVTVNKTQAVSVPGIIDRWDEIATRERGRPDAFMPPEEHTLDAAAELPSTVPLTVERAVPAKRRWQSMIWPELLHNRTARRVSAPLGLLVALLTVLVVLSRGYDSVGAGGLASPSEAPLPQATVARTAQSLVASSGTAAKQEPASPNRSSIEVGVPASQQGHVEESSHAIGPVIASAVVPGSVAAVMQSVTAPVDGLFGGPTAAGQVSASDSLAGFEVATVTPPTEAHAVEIPQTVKASVEQLRIDGLLTSAEQALREYRLTVPQGNSAWDYYRQVLQIEPQHQGASAGIQRISNNYRSRTERALAADQIDKARTYVTRGLMVSPGNRKLLALQQDVTARESWLKEQASLAAAAVAAEAAKAAALRMQATPPPQQAQPAPRFLDRLKAIFSNSEPKEVP